MGMLHQYRTSSDMPWGSLGTWKEHGPQHAEKRRSHAWGNPLHLPNSSCTLFMIGFARGLVRWLSSYVVQTLSWYATKPSPPFKVVELARLQGGSCPCHHPSCLYTWLFNSYNAFSDMQGQWEIIGTLGAGCVWGVGITPGRGQRYILCKRLILGYHQAVPAETSTCLSSMQRYRLLPHPLMFAGFARSSHKTYAIVASCTYNAMVRSQDSSANNSTGGPDLQSRLPRTYITCTTIPQERSSRLWRKTRLHVPPTCTVP